MVSTNESLIAGSVSGGTCRLLTAPLDVLKVRLQLQIEPISQVSKELVNNAAREPKLVFYHLQRAVSSKYRSLHHSIKVILKEEGITAFW